MASLPVLVVSCDGYADLWRPFFDLFWRHWPECAGPVYLGTNFARYTDPRVRTIAIGEDVTWAGSVRRMLDRIPGEYVIVMLEDFLLMQGVDDQRIRWLADVALAERLGCLRLYSILPPERVVAGMPELGWFAPGDRYRVTAQAAIWRIETLRQLLVPGFTAWDFELVGSQMSDYIPDRIWGVMAPAIVYDHAIEKGKWRPQGLAICRDAGITPNLSQRGAFSAGELQQHEQAGAAAAEVSERRHRALLRFRAGQRRHALTDVMWCMKRQPASVQLWAIAAAGLLGPEPVTWLHKLHLRKKARQARRTYRRVLGRHESRIPSRLASAGTETQKG